MKKKITAKETVLIVILLLLVAFYFVNKGPIERIKEGLESQRSQITKEINSVKPKVNQMKVWQDELDKINSKYGGTPNSIPDYNNINSIIAEMSIIFDGDSSYTIKFSSPSVSDHIVSRTIKITFSCYEYAEVISKLSSINNSVNRYRITDISITEGNNELYSVNMTIIAYEYSKDNKI